MKRFFSIASLTFLLIGTSALAQHQTTIEVKVPNHQGHFDQVLIWGIEAGADSGRVENGFLHGDFALNVDSKWSRTVRVGIDVNAKVNQLRANVYELEDSDAIEFHFDNLVVSDRGQSPALKISEVSVKKVSFLGSALVGTNPSKTAITIDVNRFNWGHFAKNTGDIELGHIDHPFVSHPQYEIRGMYFVEEGDQLSFVSAFNNNASIYNRGHSLGDGCKLTLDVFETSTKFLVDSASLQLLPSGIPSSTKFEKWSTVGGGVVEQQYEVETAISKAGRIVVKTRSNKCFEVPVDSASSCIEIRCI